MASPAYFGVTSPESLSLSPYFSMLLLLMACPCSSACMCSSCNSKMLNTPHCAVLPLVTAAAHMQLPLARHHVNMPPWLSMCQCFSMCQCGAHKTCGCVTKDTHMRAVTQRLRCIVCQHGCQEAEGRQEGP